MLARTFGCVRVVYNDFIAERQRLREAGLHRKVPFGQTQALVTAAAKQTEARGWLADVSARVLQQAARDAERAYRNWFASLSGARRGGKVGPPRFRRRSTRQTARFVRGSFRIRGGWANTRAGGGRLYLAKVGWLRVRWSRPLPAEPSSVTVIGNADGTYEVSFVVEAPARVAVAPANPGRIAGIDLGLTDFAAIAYSDGTREKVANPRHYRTAERKLARVQRALSRTQLGSRNRDKARVRVARLHARIAHLRADHARQLIARLIRENQAVVVETLSITGMIRARRMGKSVTDAGWGQFLRWLAESAAEHGRGLVQADRVFASTRICAVCGVNGGAKALHVRVWTCACGARLDRDWNAAANLLMLGLPAPADRLVAARLAETRNACGAEFSLEPDSSGRARRSEAGTRRELAVA